MTFERNEKRHEDAVAMTMQKNNDKNITRKIYLRKTKNMTSVNSTPISPPMMVS